jgi:hypothetical protein
MVAVAENKHYFDQPWPVLTFANWMKYPNEHASHVASVDVIARHLSPKGEIVTDRLLQLRQPVPTIIKKLGLPFPEISYFLERSILNRESLVFQAKSYSLSMQSFFKAKEICTYSADPESGGTLFVQKAEFTAFSFFSKIIEEVAVNRFYANAAKGRQGLESVIQKLGYQAEQIAKDAIEFEHVVEKKVLDSFHDLENSFKAEYKDTIDDLEKRFDTYRDGLHDAFHGFDHFSNPFC